MIQHKKGAASALIRTSGAASASPVWASDCRGPRGLAPMIRPRTHRPLTTGLTFGLAIVISAFMSSRTLAQPLSSGSGAGTGTGLSGGAARNSTGTGQQGGTSTGTGLQSGAGPGGRPRQNLMIPYQPGGHAP